MVKELLKTQVDFGLFYLGGWKAMVREAKEKLKAMGYSRKQIQFELYD